MYLLRTDWEIRLLLCAFETAESTELTEIRHDRRLKLKHSSTDMASCWLSLRQEYSFVTMQATEALLLSSKYISMRLASLLWTRRRSRRGSGFKHWRRTWWLSTIRPWTRNILRHHHHQAQVSHSYRYAYIFISTHLYLNNFFLALSILIVNRKY
jgi:hypothetical protein